MQTYFNDNYYHIEKVLGNLQTNLHKLATEGYASQEMIEMARGFIVLNILDSHFFKTQDLLNQCDRQLMNQIGENMQRLQGLTRLYFDCFSHYWRCYVDGVTLAKYDAIFYGESCITAIQETLRLEEKLFNLTTRDCIVK